MKYINNFIVFIAILLFIFTVSLLVTNKLSLLLLENEDEVVINKDDITYIDLSEYYSDNDKAKFVNGNLYINVGGKYNITGNLSNGTIYIDTSDNVILDLDNVKIINNLNETINNRKSKKLIINCEDNTNNILSDGENSKSSILSVGDIYLQGKGNLLIYGNNGNGITTTKGSLIIDDINLYTVANLSAFKIYNQLLINGGKVLGLGNDLVQTISNMSTQNAIFFNFDNKIPINTNLALTDENNINLVVFEILKDAKTITFSSPKLKKGNYYLLGDFDCLDKSINGIYSGCEFENYNKIKLGISDTFIVKDKNNWYGSMDLINNNDGITPI